MKKVLFISNYKENTGYGIASRRYIKALKTISNINLVVRNIGFGKEIEFNDFKKEENKDLSNIDLTIVNTLPEYCDYKINSKTIGLFYWEADSLPDNWIQNINANFDAVICANENEAKMVANQTSIKDTYFVGIPFCGFCSNIEEKIYNYIDNQMINEKTYVFGSVSSLNGRKNIAGLVTSYFLAFQDFENVILVFHFNENKRRVSEFENIVDQIKTKLKFENYPKIMYSFGEIKQEQLERLQASFDTYVSMSHGESWNLPMFDSAVLGKNIITSKCNGNEFLINGVNFREIESRISPCMQEEAYARHLYNGKQNWRNPDVLLAAEAMKEVFKDGKNPVKYNQHLVEEYSPEEIGKQLGLIIDEVC